MRRAQQTEQMRRRILDSALELFGAEGYENASVNAICEHAGISKGIVYHYFSGKEELYLSCCRESASRMEEYLRSHPVPEGTLRQKIHAYLAQRHSFFRENPRYEAVFYELMLGRPVSLRPALREIRSRLEQVNLEFLRSLAGERAGALPPEELDGCFQMLLAGIWLNAEQLASPDPKQILGHERQVIRTVEIFIRGLECPDLAQEQEEMI